MDENIKKYRESWWGRHCRFCQYYRDTSFPSVCFCDCELRDALILMDNHAKFCKYYKLKNG